MGLAVVLGLAVITTGALVGAALVRFVVISVYLFVDDVLLITFGDKGNKSIIIGLEDDPDDG